MSNYRRNDKFLALKREPDSRALKILEALSAVDEELLERCGQRGTGITPLEARRSAGHGEHDRVHKKAKKPAWRYGKSWAAVLCLAVAGAVTWGGYQLMQGGVSSDSTASVNQAMQVESIRDIFGGGETGAPEAAEVVEETESGNDRETSDPSSAVTQGSSEGDLNQGTSGTEAAGADGNGAYNNVANGDTETFSGNAGITEESEVKQESAVTDGACGKLEAEKITEAEARKAEGLGDYVPETLPAGYVFESAYLDAENSGLSVCWTRGMDSIMLHIQVPEDVPATVDVDKPETYDEYLYKIPHSETVPEEYRASFSNPVFALEDFGREIVERRMISRTDSGDTDTPRGNFAVLYPDGVLVRFNGRGTAEEIWEMFCSMGENGR